MWWSGFLLSVRFWMATWIVILFIGLMPQPPVAELVIVVGLIAHGVWFLQHRMRAIAITRALTRADRAEEEDFRRQRYIMRPPPQILFGGIEDRADEPRPDIADLFGLQKEGEEYLVCQRLGLSFLDMKTIDGDSDKQMKVLVVQGIEIEAEGEQRGYPVLRSDRQGVPLPTR